MSAVRRHWVDIESSKSCSNQVIAFLQCTSSLNIMMAGTMFDGERNKQGPWLQKGAKLAAVMCVAGMTDTLSLGPSVCPIQSLRHVDWQTSGRWWIPADHHIFAELCDSQKALSASSQPCSQRWSLLCAVNNYNSRAHLTTHFRWLKLTNIENVHVVARTGQTPQSCAPPYVQLAFTKHMPPAGV